MSTNPRVLIVTPEVTYLPTGMGNHSKGLNAKAGGLADVSAALINALYCQGADVHVALPHYRAIFHGHSSPLVRRKLSAIRNSVPGKRIHLAQDRTFFYRNHIYSGFTLENIKISLAFQREVINNIVPRVQPDLIHCNDWMTGLIPAMARQLGIPCLFTIHNIHTVMGNTQADFFGLSASKNQVLIIELGFLKGFGKFYVDLTANAEFYTDNDGFRHASVTLEKDPLFTFETHLSYDLTDAFFFSGDYYYHNGGEKTIAGIDQDDEEDDHSVGLTLGYSFTPAYQLLIQSRHDVEVENCMKERTFGLRFFYFF